MNNKFIAKMTGYKATDPDISCRGFQFELNKWYEVEGEIIECKNGFHFCEQPSGVWNYYSDPGTRVFKIEAEDILDTPFIPGTDYKRVCRRIRLIEEVKVDGDGNTGHRNTGDGNTGDVNTGHRNTGDGNTGYSNTGYSNTGYSNTGDRNTGIGNTGSYNLTNYSSGYFNISEPPVTCFGELVKMSRADFNNKYRDICNSLYERCKQPEPINFEHFKEIPNITPEKLKAYHEKMLNALENKS